MLRLSRIVALFTGAALASGCTNVVISHEPWFPLSEFAVASPLRDGVWIQQVSDCSFDTSLPVDRWPDCANWFVVRGQQLLEYRPDPDSFEENDVPTRYSWQVQNVAYGTGDPVILQVSDCPISEGVPTEGEGASIETAAFCYSAIAPTRRDAEARIVAADRWQVLCGPFPDEEAEAREIWPGLIVSGKNCIASDVAALRDAARMSRDVAETTLGYSDSIRWVREGYR